MKYDIDFQIGAELFRKKHNLSVSYPEARKIIDRDSLELKLPASVKYAWYRKVVSGQEWNKSHKYQSYTILNMTFEGKILKEVVFAFLSVIPPKDCLEITDMEDLMKIQRHREAISSYPQPFEKV